MTITLVLGKPFPRVSEILIVAPVLAVAMIVVGFLIPVPSTSVAKMVGQGAKGNERSYLEQ